MQAAGIKRGAMLPQQEFAGVVTLKHIYEIAKFKIEEENCAHITLETLCCKVLDTARSIGIKVVKDDLDPNDLKQFLEERKQITEQQLKEIQEKRTAKLMRASNTAASAKS